MIEVHTDCIFANRRDGGRALATRLDDLAGRSDVLVVGLPRGGVPVAYEIAHALDAELDVFVVRKVGAPQQPELALGAVASGGTVVLNRDIVEHLGIEDAELERLVAAERAIVQARDEAYRGSRPPLRFEDRTVVVVDDGIATGASMRVALEAIRSRRPSALVAAAPVAPPEMVGVLGVVADRVVLAATPDNLGAVGAWYGDFHQVSDDEVRQLLT